MKMYWIRLRCRLMKVVKSDSITLNIVNSKTNKLIIIELIYIIINHRLILWVVIIIYVL